MRVFQYTPVMFCHLFSNSSTVTETRWTFSIHNHAAPAISIWPLKSATDGNYSRTIGNLVKLFCLMPFLKETRVTQSAGLLASSLLKLRVAFLYIHQKEPPFPHRTAQDVTESWATLTERSPGPVAVQIKDLWVLTLWRPRLWFRHINTAFGFCPQEIC